MPILEDITSSGVFEVLEGTLSKLKAWEKVSQSTQLEGISNLNLDRIVGQFAIEDGFLIVEPFDFSTNDINFTVGGRQNITGKMDYQVAMDVPAGKIGSAANAALAKLSGTDVPQSDRIMLNIGLGGDIKEPVISGLTTNVTDDFKATATDAIQKKIEEKTGTSLPSTTSPDSLGKQAQQQVQDSLKQVTQQAKDSLKNVVEERTEKVSKEVEQKVEDKIGKEAKDKLEELKKKFPFGPKKKSG